MEVVIKKIIRETHDTITWQFDGSMDYLPGQFITLSVNQFPELLTKPNVKLGSRAYSITWPFGITIKRENNGLFSNYALDGQVKEGDKIEIKGPFGNQFKYELPYTDVLLIGAGSGIVPLYTLLSFISDKKIPVQARLLLSNKTPDNIIFRKDLEMLGENYNNIKIIHALTQYNGDDWKGRTKRIDSELIQQTASELKDPTYFICGPNEFGKFFETELLKLGIRKDKLKRESWG